MLQEYKNLAKEYNAITEDKDRLQFLKNHNTKVKVVLDNDVSMVEFIYPDNLEEEEIELITDIELNNFDKYHYWSDGNLILFAFAGISAECC